MLEVVLMSWLLRPGQAHAGLNSAQQMLIGVDFNGADLGDVAFSPTKLRQVILASAEPPGSSLFGA